MASHHVVWVAGFLSTIVLFCGGDRAYAQTRQAPPQELQWTRVDCGSAHLLAPTSMGPLCFEGGFERAQGNYDCSLNNVAVGSDPDGSEPHFYARARYPRVGSQSCVTMGYPNAADALQHVHRLLGQASNWSDIESPRSDLQLRFFDLKTQRRDGRCVSFIKNGPSQTHGKGYTFTMIGFFCKPPNQPLDTAAAIGMIDALQLKI